MKYTTLRDFFDYLNSLSEKKMGYTYYIALCGSVYFSSIKRAIICTLSPYNPPNTIEYGNGDFIFRNGYSEVLFFNTEIEYDDITLVELSENAFDKLRH